MEETYIVKSGFSLESMGFITWLVFFVLKLTKVIDWSWFWIFFPLWLPIAIGFAIFIIAVIIMFIFGLW